MKIWKRYQANLQIKKNYFLILQSYEKFLKIFQNFMNNQVCPACQSPMPTAPTNLTLDFQSNLHSIQNRRRGSSPNLFLNLNKKRLSGKKFSQNYKTENEEFSEMMNPGDANVFKRGWSRVDDQKRTSFNSSPHGEKKKILDNKNLRKMYESHQNKFPDNQVSPE